MLTSEYPKFVELLTNLANVYSKKLEPSATDMYWAALRDRPLEDVERRMTEATKRNKFFPKPNELRPQDSQERIEMNPRQEAEWKRINDESQKAWDADILRLGDIGKLHVAHALYARYVMEDDGSVIFAEKKQWLRDRVAALIRTADPVKAFNDLLTRQLVMQLFSEAGINRLEQRAKDAA